MKRHLLYAFILTLNFSFIKAQHLVSYELVESLSATEVGAVFGLPVLYGVDSYRVLYTTPDINGNDHTASGLVSIPNDTTGIYPLLAVQHGTVSSRDDVPSNLEGGSVIGLVFNGFGFVTAQADFLGLGESPGIHPYVHNDSEAWVARDLMRATREMVDELGTFGLNDQVFVTGYSQGGHAAMALHKLLEEEHNDEFTVTAASPMSGPYSISEAMVDFSLGDDEYFFSAYLAWVTLSMKTAYPNELADFEVEDVFKPQYISAINRFVNEEIDLNDLNDSLQTGLIADVGRVTPKDLIFPDILDALKNDPTHPLSVALQKQDNYDWTPNAPVRIQYCIGDDQVTFRNAIIAVDKMNENGAADVQGMEHGATLNHGGCVFPSVTATLVFFQDLAQVLSNTNDFTLEDYDQIRAASDAENVYLFTDQKMLNELGSLDVNVFDVNGRRIQRTMINNKLETINFPNGISDMTIITISSGNQLIQTLKLFTSK